MANGTIGSLDSGDAVMLNSSTQCGDWSMFIFAAPETYEQSFQGQGYICSSSYYSADIEVTALNSVASSSVVFSIDEFNRTKSPINSTTLDIPMFENAFLSQNWSSKFQAPDVFTNPTQPIRPKMGGPLILVGAQNSFDLRAMVANPYLPHQARQVKQRFLG